MKPNVDQNKRMAIVLEELKSKGETRRSIADRLSNAPNSSKIISESMLSKYCSKVKEIPEDVLNLFHSEYQVNPDYIRGNSDNMFDEAEIKYSLLTELVHDWQILEYGADERFLHLQLDKNFYQYILEIGHAEILQENGMLSSDEEEAKIRKKYNESEEDIAEYVLLPRNRFLEIIEEHEKCRHTFEELIDTYLYKNYLDDENATRSPEHK